MPQPSGLREVTRLAARGIAPARDEPTGGYGDTVRPGEDPPAAVERAWAAAGITVAVGAARSVTSDVVDDPVEDVRRWTVTVLFDVATGRERE